MPFMLYIDDNQGILDLYKDILEPKIQVKTCSDPNEGLKMAQNHYFDAIMLDIHLPGTNGFELFEKIRKYPMAKNTPIFFISSENTIDNRLKAFGMGSEDFIHKEMAPEEVLARIIGRLRNKAQNEQLDFGDIIIDQENLIVTCNKSIIELTQTEYRILLLLVRETFSNNERVISRQEMIEFVWPVEPESVYPRTLSTHLTNLRKKLKSKEVEFLSVRHEGFRLKK